MEESQDRRVLEQGQGASMNRIPREQAIEMATPLLILMTSLGIRHEICGSIRRNMPDCKDADILVEGSNLQAMGLTDEVLKSIPGMGEIRWGGPVKLSFFVNDFPMDIKAVPQESWGCGLLHHTGNMTFNVVCRTHAKRKGMKLNEYGLWKHNEVPAGADGIIDPTWIIDTEWVFACDCSKELEPLKMLFREESAIGLAENPSMRQFEPWGKKKPV